MKTRFEPMFLQDIRVISNALRHTDNTVRNALVGALLPTIPDRVAKIVRVNGILRT
jgi:hypothetical protein